MCIFLPVLDSLESVATADDLHTFFLRRGWGHGVCVIVEGKVGGGGPHNTPGLLSVTIFMLRQSSMCLFAAA